MEQLIAHLVGDYILQNNSMAKNKVENSLSGYYSCILHCLLYTFAFVMIIPEYEWWHLLLIFLTHFAIDKYRLATYWIRFYNYNFKNNNNFGFPTSTPKYMSFWLMVIIDNTFHLLTNYIILSF